MSRDTALKTGLCVFTAALGLILLLANGIAITTYELITPLGVLAVLGPCAAFYHQRQSEQLAMTLLSVIFVMIFFTCFTFFMYGGTSLGFPLIDAPLKAADEAIGVHLPAIVAWAEAHPRIASILQIAYDSVLPQTLVLVLLLGFLGDKLSLEGFVRQFMLVLVLTGLVFIFVPAEGPFIAYAFEPTAHQSKYLAELHAVRGGELTAVSLRNAEGLVTFPSFHTSWAILLIYAVRNYRFLFPISVILNSMCIAATMTTGWHYATDVIGGILMAAFVILLSRRMELHLYLPNGKSIMFQPWTLCRRPEHQPF